MLDPTVGMLISGCLALLFVSAALHKLRGLAGFTEVLRAYRVLPAALAGCAPLVPLAELAVAVGLLTPATRSGAALGGAGLLLAYAAAIGVNLGRGRYQLACGCGGPDEARPITPWMVARNVLLALLLAMTLLPWQVRPLVPTDILTIGAGAAVAALLYICLDRLLGRVAPWTRALGSPR